VRVCVCAPAVRPAGVRQAYGTAGRRTPTLTRTLDSERRRSYN